MKHLADFASLSYIRLSKQKQNNSGVKECEEIGEVVGELLAKVKRRTGNWNTVGGSLFFFGVLRCSEQSEDDSGL